MEDWNVIVSVYQDGFRRAVRALQAHGTIDRSPYHNVLVMAGRTRLRCLKPSSGKPTTNRPFTTRSRVWRSRSDASTFTPQRNSKRGPGLSFWNRCRV